MANQGIEERLVELINLASIEVDGSKKVEYLYQIKELALNHGLSENFFDNILAFQNDRAPNVKKFILAFIEAACKHDFKFCPRSILSLNLLLNDTNNEVIKRSIQAATHFYRSLVQWIVNIQSAHAAAAAADSASAGAAATAAAAAVAGSAPINQHNSQNQPSQLQTQDTNHHHNPYHHHLQPQQHDNITTTTTGVGGGGGGAGLTTTTTGATSELDNKAANPGLNNDEIEKTWLMWLQIQSLICNLLESNNNDGIRTHCIKFIETIVLMQTPSDKYTDSVYELNLIDPVIAPVRLSDEANMCGVMGLPKNGVIFNQEHKLELVEAAKRRFEQLVLFHGTSHISSVNLMATMQSLVVLAKQRYRLFMGRVIQAMESLNNRLPPTLTESQVQSVKKFLKLQLTVMLKHPYSLDRYQLQLTQLLQAVGSKQPEIHKVINEYKNKYGCDVPLLNNNIQNPELQKRIKLEPGVKVEQQQQQQQQGGKPILIHGSQASGMVGSQGPTIGKAKHLDLNKLTQELDEKEKRQIVVDSVKRILGDEKTAYISPAQMEIKKKVLATLANEFNDTECPKIIQDYIFSDLRNRHEICYAIIKKNFDVAAAKASKRQLNLLDHQELLKNYFECFNSYLSRAMELKDSSERDVILPKLYALREEYYSITNQDHEEDK